MYWNFTSLVSYKLYVNEERKGITGTIQVYTNIITNNKTSYRTSSCGGGGVFQFMNKVKWI